MAVDLMSSKLQNLQFAYEGLKRTGIPFTVFDGNRFSVPFHGDDLGIYYIIPKLALVFNIKLEWAITLFFSTLFIAPLFIGLTGFLLLYDRWYQRILTMAFFLPITFIVQFACDTYRVQAITPLITIPWVLWTQKKNRSLYIALFLYFLLGVLIGLANIIRAHAGTAMIIFIFLLLLPSLLSRKFKTIYLITLFFGMSIPLTCFSYLTIPLKNVLKTQQDEYAAVLGHALWEQIYIGLGFLNNNFGISYDDSSGNKKIREINPAAKHHSIASEKILKAETLYLIKSNPSFIFRTITAKIGILLFIFLIICNICLYVAYKYLSMWLNIAFVASISFNALPGILVMPHYTYILGFMMIAVIYSLVSLQEMFLHKNVRAANHKQN